MASSSSSAMPFYNYNETIHDVTSEIIRVVGRNVYLFCSVTSAVSATPFVMASYSAPDGPMDNFVVGNFVKATITYRGKKRGWVVTKMIDPKTQQLLAQEPHYERRQENPSGDFHQKSQRNKTWSTFCKEVSQPRGGKPAAPKNQEQTGSKIPPSSKLENPPPMAKKAQPVCLPELVSNRAAIIKPGKFPMLELGCGNGRKTLDLNRDIYYNEKEIKLELSVAQAIIQNLESELKVWVDFYKEGGLLTVNKVIFSNSQVNRCGETASSPYTADANKAKSDGGKSEQDVKEEPGEMTSSSPQPTNQSKGPDPPDLMTSSSPEPSRKSVVLNPNAAPFQLKAQNSIMDLDETELTNILGSPVNVNSRPILNRSPQHAQTFETHLETKVVEDQPIKVASLKTQPIDEGIPESQLETTSISEDKPSAVPMVEFPRKDKTFEAEFGIQLVSSPKVKTFPETRPIDEVIPESQLETTSISEDKPSTVPMVKIPQGDKTFEAEFGIQLVSSPKVITFPETRPIDEVIPESQLETASISEDKPSAVPMVEFPRKDKTFKAEFGIQLVSSPKVKTFPETRPIDEVIPESQLETASISEDKPSAVPMVKIPQGDKTFEANFRIQLVSSPKTMCTIYESNEGNSVSVEQSVNASWNNFFEETVEMEPLQPLDAEIESIGQNDVEVKNSIVLEEPVVFEEELVIDAAPEAQSSEDQLNDEASQVRMDPVLQVDPLLEEAQLAEGDPSPNVDPPNVDLAALIQQLSALNLPGPLVELVRFSLNRK